MLRLLAAVILSFILSSAALGQTTQGSLFGVVQDSVDGHLLAGAIVACENLATGLIRSGIAGTSGQFAILLLSPGQYRIRVTFPGYQPQEMQDFEVRTASRSFQPFSLRPLSDVWETRERRNLQSFAGRALLPLVGPDLGAGYDISVATGTLGSEALIPALSSVVGRRQLSALPLAGRDTYSLLISLGGVNSDAGSGRGLGLTVSGQRPSSAAFRLDGFENDNRLTTGPAVSLAPEAVDEYRVSLAHFAAEYGGTGGYLANAISREAGQQWHGFLYGYLRNAGLNANSFGRNRNGVSRPGSRELQPGVFLGGPLGRERGGITLFAETLGNRAEGDPQAFELPSTSYTSYSLPGSLARALLSRFRAPLPQSSRPSATVLLRPESRMRRTYAMLRSDQRLAADRFRLFERLILNRQDRPDFLWTPYPDFISPLRQDNLLAGISANWTPRASVLHEMRVGLGHDSLGWPRPFPEIPTLTAFNFVSAAPMVLPGSPAAYSYRQRNRRWEAGYNLTILRGTHQFKAGAQLLSRRSQGALTFGRDGRYVFPDVLNFYLDWPTQLDAAVERNASSTAAPPYEAHFTSREVAWFVQDEWHVSQNLILSAGLRYEYFGPPRLSGGTRLLGIAMGPGDAFADRIAGATLASLSSGSAAYPPDRNNFGVRTGASYKFGSVGPVLRASYGVFYDRPFDNLWQSLRTNSIQVESVQLDGFPIDYLRPVRESLRAARNAQRVDFPEMLLYQPGIRDPYAQNYFVGLSSTWGDFWQWEINHLGSFGRKLITTDRVNRPDSVRASAANPVGRFNPRLSTFAYRANQGGSNFEGLNLTLRRQSPAWMLSASYTWSHAIDNQSDPLAGDFLDLSFTANNEADSSRAVAAFARQFDSRGDRGNSDFDQRHNLVLLGSWQVPALGPERLRAASGGWRISWLTAVRSGLPFTVFAPGGLGIATQLYNRRADYVGGMTSAGSAIAGGTQWLNPRAFAIPSGDRQGNLGRNSLRAPGFYSLDASVAKTFALPGLTESSRVTLRADAFNLLNHSNLDRPQNLAGADNFGVALFGRRGRQTSFPASSPLDESPRTLQIGLRVEF